MINPLRSVLIALSVSWVSLAAITVTLTGPGATSASVASISISVQVTNTGPDSVRLFKPNSILDNSGWHAWTITGPATPPFKGVGYFASLQSADATGAQYVTLTSGQSTTVVHNNFANYDFATSGLGAYSFAPKNRLINVPTGFAKPAVLTFTVAPATTTLTGLRRRGERLIKRATTVDSASCTAGTQLNFITAALTEAKNIATITSANIATNATLFSKYFGTTATADVKGVYDRITADAFTRTVGCNDPRTLCGGAILAYFDYNNGNSYFCPNFFTKQVASPQLCSGVLVDSRSTRGGAVLNALVHGDGTVVIDDVIEGCAYDAALNPGSTAQAVKNSDNYNCFATSVYQNKNCQA